MSLRILADINVFCIYELFGLYNDIRRCEGRVISVKDLQNTDVLIIRSVTKVNQKLLSNHFVRFVGTVTSGVDHVDQDFLKRNGIAFFSAPGNNAVAVVEYVFAALFWLAKHGGFFLRDKVVGIIGVGCIGSLLHQRLHSFGVHTILCDPFLSKKSMVNNNWKSLEQLVSEADVLTLHTPLTYEGDHPTWHMIDINVLDALSANTILINTCRGAVLDNNALLKVLSGGKKLNVVLDVWESEPDLSMPLLSYVTIGTPHIAGYTLESKIRGVIHIYNEYCDFFNILKSMHKLCSLCPIIHHIRINNKIDEAYLYRLIKYMHNISYDNIIFKRFIFKPRGFDRLRRCYIDRREWSALRIETYSDYNYEVLTGLGFNVCL